MKRQKRNFIFRILIFFVLLIFFSAQIIFTFPSLGDAQEILNLPQPGVMVTVTPPLTPPLLIGLKIHPEHPLKFDFFLDRGDAKKLDGDQLKDESTKLIKYFLAAFTIPRQDLWVNLSPYEKERIISKEFGLTEMGRDLLVQDYFLKQLLASLNYPEEGLGKNFWDRVYLDGLKLIILDINPATFNEFPFLISLKEKESQLIRNY